MIKELFGGLLVAFGLYSALPLPQIEWKDNTMRYALSFLPLIGLLVGVCEYGWLLLAGKLALSSLLYAAGAVLIPVVITGGIHLDGFVDTCDALCSYGDKEKRLEILKDPHVGAFAILWIGVLLMVQLGMFAQVYETPASAKLFCLGYAGARALGGGMIVTQPCAKNSGLAHIFADSADKKTVSHVMLVWELVLAVLTVVLAKGIGVLAIAAYAGFYCFHIRMCRRNFGGITGDLCGMCITVCETLLLLCVVIGGIILR